MTVRCRLPLEFSRMQALAEKGDAKPSAASLEPTSPWLKPKRNCACQHDTLCMDIIGDRCDCVFGVRWTEEQFITQAVAVGHPFDNFTGVSMEIKEACNFIVTHSDGDVARHRTQMLQRWIWKAKELQYADSTLKAGLPSDMRVILESKTDSVDAMDHRRVRLRGLPVADGHSEWFLAGRGGPPFQLPS